METLKEFFQEGNGSFSSARLVFIFGVMTIFIVWAVECFVHKTFQPFDGTHVGMVGTLGALKAGQKMMEDKPSV